jgi:hypothetical protein
MVLEITIEQLEYQGNSALEPRLEGAMDLTVVPDRLRLETYVDGSDLRDPYIITTGPVESFSINRTWGFNTKIEFQLWGVPPSPEDLDFGYDNEQPDHQYQTKLGSATFQNTGPSQGWEGVGLGGDLQIDYEIAAEPDRTTIDSALHDFDAEIDDGMPYVDKAAVYSVAESFGSRVDQTGADNSPDGYPDETIELVDQGSTQYCAGASLFVNYGIFQPRKLVELCRSVYQPRSYSSEGHRRHGFLTKSIASTFDPSDIERFITARTGDMPETQAVIELLLALNRSALRILRPVLNTLDDTPEAGPGLDDPEIEVMISELFEVSGTKTLSKQSQMPDAQMLRYTQEEIDNDNVHVFTLDSSLTASPNNPSGVPTIDHAIRILDTNVPAINDSGYIPNTVEVDYQQTNGGGADTMTYPKSTIDKYTFSVVVGDR